MAFFASRRLVGRLDDIRSRLQRTATERSSSLEGAVGRLEAAALAHISIHEANDAASARLRRAFDLVPQGIVLVDDMGDIVFRNRAAAAFVEARHGDALVGPVLEGLLEAAVSGRSETRVVDLFGPPRRTLELRAGPLRVPDHVDTDEDVTVGAFVMLDDISERRRMEDVRRDFVANISHELKTPVSALGVLAETLAAEDDPQVMCRLAARIQHEAFRVADTIDDLLQLSRIESDGAVEPVPVDIAEVVADAVARTSAAAELAGVGLVADPPSATLDVLGDRAQLVSAVSNLCDNAVKYTDEGGRVSVGVSANDGDVTVTVTDDGVGIPARDIERIFERFYRVDRARSRDTGGTGLGLSIVRHVAHNHGGEVYVSSKEGEGSTFTFRVPLASSVDAGRSER